MQLDFLQVWKQLLSALEVVEVYIVLIQASTHTESTGKITLCCGFDLQQADIRAGGFWLN